MARDHAKVLARQKRYEQSDKGRATKRRYEQSEKGRIVTKRRNSTPAAKVRQDRWRATPGGIIVRHLYERSHDRMLRNRLRPRDI